MNGIYYHLEARDASPQLLLVDFHVLDVHNIFLTKLKIIHNLRRVHGINNYILFGSPTHNHDCSFHLHFISHLERERKEKGEKSEEGGKPYIPDHGHLEGGLEGELGEQEGVVVELRTNFGVQKLLAEGEDVGELADAALQLPHRVVAADTDGVLLAAPFDG